MGHASHEPWAYHDTDSDEQALLEEAWLASTQPKHAPRIVPAHERPDIAATDPFPEDDPPPPPQPWDNGRMFGRKAYPHSPVRRGWGHR